MKKLISVILIVALCLSSAVFCFAEGQEAAPKNVVFFGNSYLAGIGLKNYVDTPNTNFLDDPIPENYAKKVFDAIGGDHVYKQYSVRGLDEMELRALMNPEYQADSRVQEFYFGDDPTGSWSIRRIAKKVVGDEAAATLPIEDLRKAVSEEIAAGVQNSDYIFYNLGHTVALTQIMTRIQGTAHGNFDELFAAEGYTTHFAEAKADAKALINKFFPKPVQNAVDSVSGQIGFAIADLAEAIAYGYAAQFISFNANMKDINALRPEGSKLAVCSMATPIKNLNVSYTSEDGKTYTVDLAKFVSGCFAVPNANRKAMQKYYNYTYVEVPQDMESVLDRYQRAETPEDFAEIKAESKKVYESLFTEELADKVLKMAAQQIFAGKGIDLDVYEMTRTEIKEYMREHYDQFSDVYASFGQLLTSNISEFIKDVYTINSDFIYQAFKQIVDCNGVSLNTIIDSIKSLEDEEVDIVSALVGDIEFDPDMHMSFKEDGQLSDLAKIAGKLYLLLWYDEAVLAHLDKAGHCQLADTIIEACKLGTVQEPQEPAETEKEQGEQKPAAPSWELKPIKFEIPSLKDAMKNIFEMQKKFVIDLRELFAR